MVLFQFIGLLIIVFALMAFFTVLSIVIRFWNIIKAIFHIGGRQNGGGGYNTSEKGGFGSSSDYTRNTYQRRQSNGTSGTTRASSSRQKGKIIPDDEGEYVDFEEIR